MSMNLERDLFSKVRLLPTEQRREVLELVTRLQHERRIPKRGKSLAGLWAKYRIDLSQEVIRQARHQMWIRFPRDV